MSTTRPRRHPRHNPPFASASPGQSARAAPRWRSASPAPPRASSPPAGRVEGRARIALFIAQAEGGARSPWRRSTPPATCPPPSRPTCARTTCPPRCGWAPTTALAALPWGETPLAIAEGPSDGTDLNAVSHADCGVAETGTLALTSGPENPTTLNFLPDNHIVVLDAADVVGDYETFWSRLRERLGKGAMPRTVNWVTGPSRSADIEQTMFLGAHGPRRLHIVLVGGGSEAG